MGVGMPASLYLDEFASQILNAFDCIGVFHVGSSLGNKRDWRDVDVRVMLADEIYEAMDLGDPYFPHHNPKWVSLCLAYSALGKQMTGLPIDCQIQQMTRANREFGEDHKRSSIGYTPLRLQMINKG